MIILPTSAALALAGALLMQGGTAPILREPPRRGELRPGQVVLVDDGSCPSGQLREITGGSNAQQRREARDTHQLRQSRCVPRP